MSGNPASNPGEAQTPAQFLEMMRQLKRQNGLTFSQLEEQASLNADAVSGGSLADALEGDELPPGPFVEAFVRACGCSRVEEAEWMRAHYRLSALQGWLTSNSLPVEILGAESLAESALDMAADDDAEDAEPVPAAPDEISGALPVGDSAVSDTAVGDTVVSGPAAEEPAGDVAEPSLDIQPEPPLDALPGLTPGTAGGSWPEGASGPQDDDLDALPALTYNVSNPADFEPLPDPTADPLPEPQLPGHEFTSPTEPLPAQRHGERHGQRRGLQPVLRKRSAMLVAAPVLITAAVILATLPDDDNEPARAATDAAGRSPASSTPDAVPPTAMTSPPEQNPSPAPTKPPSPSPTPDAKAAAAKALAALQHAQGNSSPAACSYMTVDFMHEHIGSLSRCKDLMRNAKEAFGSKAVAAMRTTTVSGGRQLSATEVYFKFSNLDWTSGKLGRCTTQPEFLMKRTGGKWKLAGGKQC